MLFLTEENDFAGKEQARALFIVQGFGVGVLTSGCLLPRSFSRFVPFRR